MRWSTGDPIRLWHLGLVTLAVAGLLLAVRALGFGDGVILGATPASGLALVAVLILRWRAALAVAAGFAIAGFLWGLAPGEVVTDTGARGLAALLGASTMLFLARRRRPETKTHQWLVFLAGVIVFTATVVAGIVAGGLAGLLGTVDLREAALLAAVFEPLGIMTACALLLSVREFPVVVANLRPAFGIVALALILLGLFWLLLGAAGEQASRSGIALALSVPFCLWVAMQRRSLDGAALSFVAAHLVLLFMLHACGTIDHAEFVNTIIYLDLLVATCQLVHAVNIDRVRALAEIEAHKRDLEARVAERTAKLSEMTERALAADAAKSKFVATVSHEIRNPLNGVIGMASLVLAGDLDERARRNVEVIRTSGLHLLDVVNRILDFSRLGHEPAAEELITFDLSELIGEVLGEAAASPHAQGLALRQDIDPALATRRVGSRQGLRQVLTNLVGNATKFTDAGSVTLRAVDRPDGIVRIEVEDTGIGIPDEMREKVFRPFEQVGASQARRPGGTGLGLAICAETVERMGGRIGLGSAAGGGSLFWVELPLARAGAALHSIGQQAAASA